MALGSTSNDFNTPGVKENCIFLDNPHQARRFHQEMLNLFLKYSANLGRKWQSEHCDCRRRRDGCRTLR